MLTTISLSMLLQLPPFARRKVSVGSKLFCRGDIYIVSGVMTSGQVCLINTHTGIRWTNPILVENWNDINENELIALTRATSVGEQHLWFLAFGAQLVLTTADESHR